MAELKYTMYVRRKGSKVHDSEEFSTEEFADIEELVDSVTHYIRETYEANYKEFIGGDDDNG